MLVEKLVIVTPRKPNSARRKCIKGEYKVKKIVKAYVPGGAHNLKKFLTVLLKGKGARDLPGIYSKCIRGKYDLHALILKTRRRSIFGTKKPLFYV